MIYTCQTLPEKFMESELIIDPETGRIDKITRDVGTKTAVGYVHLRVGNTFKLAHRLIWEYVNGPIPRGMWIDHINGDKSDNRITNLRLATPAQNAQNRPTTAGVSFCKRTGKWLAQIGHGRKRHYLGRFDDRSDAEISYANAAALLHTHNPKSLKNSQPNH